MRFRGIAIVCFICAVGCWSPPMARPAAPELLSRALSRRVVFVHTPVAATLQLSPDRLPRCQTLAGQALDIVLVMDRSSSMGDDAQRPIIAARQAAHGLIATMNLALHRIAIVAFNKQAKLLQSLTTSEAEARQAISALEPSGDTEVQTGLQLAMQELARNGQPNAIGVIVLVSDGVIDKAREQDVFRVAAAAKDAGVRLMTIGLGAKVNAALLRRVASAPADYHQFLSPVLLQNLYASVEAEVNAITATHVQLIDQAHAKRADIDAQSLAPPGRLEGDRIIWPFPYLTDHPVRVTYTLVPRRIGWYPASAGEAQVTLQDCRGVLLTQSASFNPRLLVLPPLWPWLPLLLLLLLLLPLWRWRREQRSQPAPAASVPDMPTPWAPAPAPVYQARKPPLLPPLTPAQTTLAPTLVVGLGPCGRWVLTHLKRNLLERHRGVLPAGVRFLLIDVSPESASPAAAEAADVGGVALSPDDIIDLSGNVYQLSQELAANDRESAHLQSWWPARHLLSRLPASDFDLALGSQRSRLFGRMALFQDMAHGPSASRIERALQQAFNELGARPGAAYFLRRRPYRWNRQRHVSRHDPTGAPSPQQAARGGRQPDGDALPPGGPGTAAPK